MTYSIDETTGLLINAGSKVTTQDVEIANSKTLKEMAKAAKISKWYDMNSATIRASLRLYITIEAPTETAIEAPTETAIEAPISLNSDFSKVFPKGEQGVCKCCDTDYRLQPGPITDYFRVRKSPYRLWHDCKSCVSKMNARKSRVAPMVAGGWRVKAEQSAPIGHDISKPWKRQLSSVTLTLDHSTAIVEFGGNIVIS